tara:strand:+ start:1376 stop:1672 length:297 start_codon:yes stop_codon:yes gene_type:complete
MAAGDSALVEYKLIDGKTVNLNINHIVSMEELTAKEIKKESIKTFGSSIPRFTNTNKILMSNGDEYIVASSDTSSSFASIKTDIKATIAKGGLSGGRF